MKRHAIALGAGLLLLGLLPGSVLADTTANMDQKNIPSSTAHAANGANALAQTFTAGKTGMLVEVGLYLASDGGTTATIDIYATDGTTGFPTGSSLATSTASVPTNENWVYFAFTPPLSVASGTKYAIVTGNDDAYGVIGSAENYSRGDALRNSGGWSLLSLADANMADLGFVTFVDTVAPTLAWSETSVTAGTSTSLTLTETANFVNGQETSRYNAQLTSALPAWFNPTSIACSDTAAEIAAADCTVAFFETGFGDRIDAIIGGDVVTITLTGTAAPAAADAGATSVSAMGCLKYSAEGPPLSGACASTAARITVAAAAPTPTPTPAPTAAPTAPPTSTTSGSSPDGSGLMLWFLPIGLIAALGGLLALTTRTRRRIA